MSQDIDIDIDIDIYIVIIIDFYIIAIIYLGSSLSLA